MNEPRIHPKRRPKEKDTQVPQSSVPSDPTNIADKAIHEEPMYVHDAVMFDVNDLDGDEVVVESEVTDKACEKRNIIKEAVAVTDAVTIPVKLKSARPKTKGVVMQEPSESTPTISLQLPSQVKGQCFKQSLMKKFGIAREKAQQGTNLREKKEPFAAKIVEEKWNRPPTISSKKEYYVYSTEGMIVQEQQKVMEESSKRIEGSETREESSSKRAGDELEQENAKKQKMDNDQEAAKMKELMKIFIDEEEVAVDVIPLATKPPSIVD
ncbi:hypothetical protein Tco_0801851 [Tanacetum coccineum]|uniref:Uncharacterized protein n=1 Tax=Tanacetum coccineum TaxID=301880 RepID=A0ABQ5A1F2_9ASTR